MKHTQLTAKYRPQTFSNVIGQDIVCRILSRASLENMVAPAYILSGTRGVGKTTLARIFAKALNCSHAPTAEPCGVCGACVRISNGSFIDVIELDAASNRSIEDIRNLRENVGFAPMEGRYKIFILDEAHMLTREAYNALLKTLEEPPQYVTFIFASTDIQKFPATIISRCQHLVLRSVPNSLLVAHLTRILDKEGYSYTADALELLAERGAGSVRDTLSIAGQVIAGTTGMLTRADVQNVLGLATDSVFIELLQAISEENSMEVIKIVSTVQEQGIDIKYFLQELTMLFRTMFLYKQSGEKALSLLSFGSEGKQGIAGITKAISLQHIHAGWQMVVQAQRKVLDSIEPSVALELVLLNIASLPSLLALSSLTREEQQIATSVDSTAGECAKKKVLNTNSVVCDNIEPEEICSRVEEINLVDSSVESTAENILYTAEEKKQIIIACLEEHKKVNNIRTVAIESGECILYAHSHLALERLTKEYKTICDCIATKFPELTCVLKTVEEANIVLQEAMQNTPLVQIIEQEFGVQGSYRPKR